MLNVTPTQIMGLWEQLMRCIYNDSPYAGTVAEIYLYTVMARDPMIELNRDSTHSFEIFAQANQTLYDLCRLFEQRNDVKLSFYDQSLEHEQSLDVLIATPHDPWRHRVHIGLQKNS